MSKPAIAAVIKAASEPPVIIAINSDRVIVFRYGLMTRGASAIPRKTLAAVFVAGAVVTVLLH